MDVDFLGCRFFYFEDIELDYLFYCYHISVSTIRKRQVTAPTVFGSRESSNKRCQVTHEVPPSRLIIIWYHIQSYHETVHNNCMIQ